MSPTEQSASEYLQRGDFEALVIGSGFGGAVAVCRLAQAGVDVAVVERGRRWRPGSFPRDLSRLDDGWLWLCNYGLYDATPLNDILAVRAAGYGGGSLVYANVAARMPADIFDERWPAAYTRESLDPYYDLASYMLDVRPVTVDPASGRLPPKARLMAQAAEQLGHADGFFHPNLAVTFADDGPGQRNAFGVPQRGCVFCGECDIGCNVGAKNSLDLNYLALSEQHGATVGTLTEAVHISRTDTGYRVRLREHGRPEGARDGVERDVTARYVFLSAGALGSTELLLRSRDQYGTLPDLPAALGSGYSGNGDFLSFGAGLDQPFEPSSGPTITTASLIRTARGDQENWFVLEDGGYSKHLAALVQGLRLSQLPAYVARSIGEGTQRVLASTRGFAGELDASHPDTAVLLAMGRDHADGRITLRGRNHRLSVTWDVTRSDPLYAEEQAFSGELVRRFGGRPFVTPTWRLLRQPVTVHNLGGAPMGTDAATAVVNTEGQVFGHPGLYVVDGAILPGATGGNPSLTIAAVAERCLEAAVRSITGIGDWVAPEHAAVVPREIPEDAAVDAVVRRGPRASTAPGIRFREVMRGGVALPDREEQTGRVTLRLNASIPELRSFLDDPVHTVGLTGTIHVEGMTSHPEPVVDGVMHLLANVDGGPACTMDYLVPFTDDEGTRWLLQGRKYVQRARGNNPWRATTVLHVAVTQPDDRFEGTIPTGTVTISPAETARLLTSIRPTGTTSVPSAARALLTFARHFTTQVARAYLSPRHIRR
ncbi:GMC oxidoreductase [Kribbella sp. CA-247076]|uniref:GMC oxidoreductase n=1 Tax=Kribbella sp. CA-247076 TaxID=3239941 RepID=UPI003D8F32EC